MTRPDGAPKIAYDWAVLRLVPHPHLERWWPIGVVLHARTEEWIGARVVTDPQRLAELAPDLDAPRLLAYLRNWLAIARGEDGAGAVAHHPPSERFHWLTCPRSDVLQASTARRGVTDDLDATLERIWNEQVGGDGT